MSAVEPVEPTAEDVCRLEGVVFAVGRAGHKYHDPGPEEMRARKIGYLRDDYGDEAEGWFAAGEAEASCLQPPPDPDKFVILRREDVELSRPVAIVPNRIYRGGLSVIGGRQGDGKGKMIRDLVARATRGGPWPFGDPAPFEPLTVIDFNAEDDPSGVIFPEYDAAGANYDRLQVICVTESDLPPHLSDAHQLDQLRDLICDLKADWVTIDPASHFFPGIEFNKAESVIDRLSPMMSFAKKNDVAITIVAHFNKSSSDNALSKFLGSVQWTAIARSALGVVPDPAYADDETSERRLLMTPKNNLVRRKDRPPWGFEITENSDRRCVIAWDATKSETTEADAFCLDSCRKDSPRKAEIKDWLRRVLADGVPHAVVDIEVEAAVDKRGSWSYVRRIADELGVTKTQNAFHGPHYWQLDKKT